MYRLNGQKAKRISVATAMRYQQRFMGHVYNSVFTGRVLLLNRDSDDTEYCIGWVNREDLPTPRFFGESRELK